jgi:hypothetical protein
VSEQNKLLEISPFKIDNGELVGRAPTDVPLEDLREKFSAQNPLKALRARCLDCCVGDASEVRKCVAIDCPSWAFRMGKNPFRKKMVLSEEERQRRAALLHGTALLDMEGRS